MVGLEAGRSRVASPRSDWKWRAEPPAEPILHKNAKHVPTLGDGGGRRGEDSDAAVPRVFHEIRPAVCPGADADPELTHLKGAHQHRGINGSGVGDTQPVA